MTGEKIERWYDKEEQLSLVMRALEFAVRDGDEYACKVWDEMVERNAQAMGMLLNIFNPGIITLGTIAV